LHISHSFIKVKDLIEEEENGINEKDKKNKYKKIGESGGIPVYGEGPEIIEYKSDDNDENTMVEIPDFL
jgi:hypothetical protein